MLERMTIDTPLKLYTARIAPEWIDYNGHMNVAFYVLVFDQATDELLDYLGMDASYRERSGCTTYVLETHVTYQHELKLDDPVEVSCQLLDWDTKRLHYFQRMTHARDGYTAATSEIMLMHIDASATRGAAMPSDVCAKLEEIHQRHATLDTPAQRGQVIGIRR